MSESEYTPGPWRQCTPAEFGDGGLIGDANRRMVASCYGDERPTAERNANARLIAAAPDMAEALRDLLSAVTAGQSHLDTDARVIAARAALSKARGESVTLYSVGVPRVVETIGPRERAMIDRDTEATIESVKGTHQGTIESCLRWQAEYQGAYPTLIVDGETYDVVDCSAETIEADIAAQIEAIEAEGGGR